MADELLDWADVMAEAVCVALTDIDNPFRPAQETVSSYLREAYLAGKADQPDAIRDAYNAGVESGHRDARDAVSCDLCGETATGPSEYEDHDDT
jgi:hypothetical protein